LVDTEDRRPNWEGIWKAPGRRDLLLLSST
jgi:hypothetical protein